MLFARTIWLKHYFTVTKADGARFLDFFKSAELRSFTNSIVKAPTAEFVPGSKFLNLKIGIATVMKSIFHHYTSLFKVYFPFHAQTALHEQHLLKNTFNGMATNGILYKIHPMACDWMEQGEIESERHMHERHDTKWHRSPKAYYENYTEQHCTNIPKPNPNPSVGRIL